MPVSLSPVAAQGPPKPLCPVPVTLQAAAPDAHGATQFKSSLWLWGQRSRKPGPGPPGRQKSLFAQVRSPKRPEPLDPSPTLTIIG